MCRFSLTEMPAVLRSRPDMTRLVRVFGLTVVSMAVVCGSVQAGFFTGSINAHFENPVLSGSVYGGGGYNNTSSAVYSIYGDGSVATINWGTNAGAPGSSTLNFFANQSVAVSDNVEFQFGKVTFYNGTSTLESLIFGVDLVLDFIPSGGGPAVDTLTVHVGIGTTFNGGDASANADFISIPGIDKSFFAFEDLAGSAHVNGQIVGDPYFVPESFTVLEQFSIYTGPSTPRPYNPDDYTTYDSPGFAGGFTGPTPTPTPEPSSIVLWLTGALSFVGLRSVRRMKKRS
jgi:hypothetical protein